MNPSSQLKMILFGNVDSNPTDDPFWGTGSGPQSLAKNSGKGSHFAHRKKIIVSHHTRDVIYTYFVIKKTESSL